MIRKFFEARKLRPYKLCAMVLDLRGRSIRSCPRTEPAEGIYFEMGETTRIRSDEFNSGNSKHDCIQVDNSNLPKAVRPGDNVGFNDNKLTAVVLECEADNVKI
jgi:pyruvate kinase